MVDSSQMPVEPATVEVDAAPSSRREFLGRAGLAGVAAAGLLAPWAAAQSATMEMKNGSPTMSMSGGGAGFELYPGAVKGGKYVLPDLPYAYDALEPHIDAETMKLHHDKHHAGYVKGLIAAEEGLAKAEQSGDYAQVKALSRNVTFHGAGHFLHCIFWANMAAKGGEPSSDLSSAIDSAFGSMDAFKAHFSAAAAEVEGSGWGMLAWSIPAKKLVILQVENHNNLTQWANIPLLVVDVWEHAYYKKYSNVRADYIKAFMNVVNWQNVSDRHAAVSKMFA